MLLLRPGAFIAVFILLVARLTVAQEVGTIASLEGSAEIERGGNSTPAAIGSAINQGDTVRTGKPGRLSIAFQDDSVVTVADDSQVVIDEQVFNPGSGTVRSVLDLLRGKVHAVVGEYYHAAGTAYEVKTVTAVAGVRGTEFSVTYDPVTDVTEVIGVSGLVEVHSLADPTAPGVLVRASEMTTVARGQLPAAPRRLQETFFRQSLEGIQFVGAGRAESLLAGNAVRAGSTVSAPERAPGGTNTASPVQNPLERHDASNLVGQSPDILRSPGQLGITFPR